MIINGNSIEKLKDLPENSVNSIVTDPPYGLSFMGKKGIMMFLVKKYGRSA